MVNKTILKQMSKCPVVNIRKNITQCLIQCLVLFQYILERYSYKYRLTLRTSGPRRVKQCDLVLSSLPAKMCQSRPFTVRQH